MQTARQENKTHNGEKKKKINLNQARIDTYVRTGKQGQKRVIITVFNKFEKLNKDMGDNL